ncbi:hypothetical protein LCGC14_1389560 [marine sediment metagenome]|uniref:Uncharacterized protein n=1 Tax=marine sediment metagenome TaxID=412755 RepID=A0A0F9N1Y2_9ZZZZ
MENVRLDSDTQVEEWKKEHIKSLLAHKIENIDMQKVQDVSELQNLVIKVVTDFFVTFATNPLIVEAWKNIEVWKKSIQSKKPMITCRKEK